MRKFSSLVILFIVVYIALFTFYNLVNQGLPPQAFYLQMRRYIPCALTMMLAVALWSGHFQFPRLVSHLIVSLSWIITYPLFYFISMRSVQSTIDNHFDIAFGAYCFGLTVFGHFILRKLFPHMKRAVTCTVTLIQFIFLLLPIGQWVHWYFFRTYVSEKIVAIILQASAGDAWTYMSVKMGWSGVAATLAICLVLLCTLYRANTPGTYTLPPLTITNSREAMILAVIFFIIVCTYAFPCFSYTGIPATYFNVRMLLSAAL